MTRFTNKRAGFTLIELMVVMALMAALAAMVMLAAPGIMDKDRARDAASQLQGALQNARLRAMRDGLPRGVRLLVDQTTLPVATINPNNPSQNIFFTSSSYQYIEVPPWLILTNASGASATNTSTSPPFLQLNYFPNPNAAQVNGTGPAYPSGSVGTLPTSPSRTCTIGGLTPTQLVQLSAIVNGPPTPATPVTVGLPTLNVWTQIVPGSLTPNPLPSPIPPALTSCNVNLTVYPDSQLGGATSWVTTTGFAGPAYFGIYQAPRPLLGETIMQMPLNTCVDLSDGLTYPWFSSLPGAIATPSNPTGLLGYDILFSPSGQLMSPAGIGQVYLWVRDPTKGIVTPGIGSSPGGNLYCSMCPSASTLGSYPINQYSTPTGAYATATTQGQPYNTALNQGGEQLLVTIKASSGGTGVSPIFWGNPPYYYSITTANSP